MDTKTIIQIISALISFIALAFIWYQLRQQTKHLKFETLTQIHKEVFTKDFREALGLVFSGDPKSQKKEIEESIRLVAGVYDLIGVRVQAGALPWKLTLKTEWKILVFLWRRIRGFIEREGENRGIPYKEHLKWLAIEAERYRGKYHSDCNPKTEKVTDYIEECINKGLMEDINEPIEPKILFRGKYLHFYLSRNYWEYVQRANIVGGVTIVAVTNQKKILLVEQYRLPIKKNVIELPAGLVGDEVDRKNETFEDAVKRELQEETGYICQKIKFLCKGPVLPGLTDEINAIFLANELTKIEGHKNPNPKNVSKLIEKKQENSKEDEKITVHEVPLDEVMKWLENQAKNEDKVVDLKVYAGLFFLDRLITAETSQLI